MRSSAGSDHVHCNGGIQISGEGSHLRYMDGVMVTARIRHWPQDVGDLAPIQDTDPAVRAMYIERAIELRWGTLYLYLARGVTSENA